MIKKEIPLAHLKKGKTGKIISIHGGHHGRHHGGNGLKKRLNVLGIREGQTVTIVSKQPLMGPLTISVCNSQVTLGRGMAHKIFVEEV